MPTSAVREPPPPAVPAVTVPESRPAPAPVVVAREPPSTGAVPGPAIGLNVYTTNERRTALVIGNAAYRAAPLRNAVNDATDMASTLRQLGFNVVELHDAGHQQMEEGVEQFTRQLGRGGMGLFYFSGHGVQVNGQNYLIPVDARISRESDIKYQSVQVDWVLDRMRDAKTLQILAPRANAWPENAPISPDSSSQTHVFDKRTRPAVLFW
jgi:Caspase domain